MSHLETVPLPEFGMAETLPEIAIAEYQARLAAAVERMAACGLDALVVYADREHLANMAYLTGFDPRFEEALLILDGKGSRTLVVGNECMGYLPDVRLGLQVALFQEFSLMGQPRGSSRPLRRILGEAGIGRGQRVGCVGYKYFAGSLIEGGDLALDVPAYLVDLLRDMTGERDRVRNATGIFMEPAAGLRATNTADQLAQFEFAACRTSESVRAVVQRLRPGVTERELEPLLDGAGLPLSCHRMIGFGDKARRGLASPSARRAQNGDVFTVALGVWGSLTSRAGVIGHGPEDLPAAVSDFYPRFAANYFDVVVAWYEALRLGATGGQVCAAVEAARDTALYDFAVNPGHLLHLDEWLHSPFTADSDIPLRSGMALQMDIIPVSRGPFCYSNAEDTLCLAGEALRADLAARFPECWRRIQARRDWMARLGIRLDPCVLPLGNTPAWLAPYAQHPERAFVK